MNSDEHSIYGNYNLEVGDVIIFKKALTNAYTFKPGAKAEIIKIKINGYITIRNMHDHDRTTWFHVESLNASRSILSIKWKRIKKINLLIDEDEEK